MILQALTRYYEDLLAEGKISPSRHRSYVRLYELAKENKPWEKN